MSSLVLDVASFALGSLCFIAAWVFAVGYLVRSHGWW